MKEQNKDQKIDRNDSLVKEYKDRLSDKKLDSLNSFFCLQIKDRSYKRIEKMIGYLKKCDTYRNEQEAEFLQNYTLQFDYVRYLYKEYKFLNPNFHRTLCQCMRYETFKKGSKIYLKGDNSDKIYFIIEGSVNQMVPKSKGDIEKEKKWLIE